MLPYARHRSVAVGAPGRTTDGAEAARPGRHRRRPRRLRRRDPRGPARPRRGLRREGAARSAAPACASAASRARRCSSRASATTRRMHELAAHGIGRRGACTLDLETMLARKDEIVAALTGGIDWPLQEEQDHALRGHGAPRRARARRRCDGDEDRRSRPSTSSSRRGSVSAACSGVELDGDVIGDQHRGAAVARGAEAPGRDRRGLHRTRAGLGVAAPRREGHGARVPRPHPARHGRRDRAPRRSKLLKKQGLEFRLGARVTGARADGRGSRRRVRGRRSRCACDRVLLAVGRKPLHGGPRARDRRRRARRSRPDPRRRALPHLARRASTRSAT